MKPLDEILHMNNKSEVPTPGELFNPYLNQQLISMQCISNSGQNADGEIINNLRTTGIIKRKAEEQLFMQYSYFITIGENKYSLRSEDLFDAYSDTILAVIHSISNGFFQKRASLKTYVYEIYNNKCIDLIRRGLTRKNAVHKTESINDLQMYLSDNSLSVVEKLTKQSDFALIKEKMHYLSANCQQVILLSADGYSDKEIAEIVKFKTAEVAKTTRLRGLRKLRKLVLRP
ncbi:MAG: sigma-70 family RNA polymerase sigma factor [Chitinophagaceae bacterium]